MSSDAPVALVTGSTRGIGRAVARRLIADGWIVGVNGRNPQDVQDAADELGPLARPVPFDVTDSRAVLEGVSALRRDAGAIHAVVHSAGAMKDAPLGMLTDDLVDEQLTMNIAAALYVTQAAARAIGRNGGNIVLMGSVAGEDGATGQVLYAATKAAIGGIVRSAAKELGPRGIRVNSVVPGIIDTDLTAGLSAARKDELATATALRRNGQPDDVADVVSFLVSSDARFVTGEQIRVTGGLRLS